MSKLWNKAANYRGEPCKYCGKWRNMNDPQQVGAHDRKCKKRKEHMEKWAKQAAREIASQMRKKDYES